MSGNEGIFTQPGPDGILGRGGEPQDASAPSIDADDQMLRETLVVAYPSPGHMRVARAIRHPHTHKVEFQEEYRSPTPSEVELLAKQGIKVGRGSMIQSRAVSGIGDAGVPGETGPPVTVEEPGLLNTLKRQPWLKLGTAVAVGAVGFWVAQKWVVPMVQKKWGAEADADEPDDVDDDADDE